MELEVLKAAGQIAGIGGLALGILLLVFRDILRKNVLAKLSAQDAFRLLRLVIGGAWSVALIGVAAWIYVETVPPPVKAAKTDTGIANIGKQTIGSSVTIEGSDESTAVPNGAGATTGTGIANTGEQTIEGPVLIQGGPSPAGGQSTDKP